MTMWLSISISMLLLQFSIPRCGGSSLHPQQQQQADCSMSGTKSSNGSCVCDAGFSGPQCTALRGGSPIRAADGTYHLFFSWFKLESNETSPNIKNWFEISVVAHATSTQPGDNYTFQDIVFPPRGRGHFDGTTTHNPTVVTLPDGSFAIFYIGLNCLNASADCVKHQWIGAAHATNLNGPWERLDYPVLTGATDNWEGGMVANPSVVALANGSLLMAYRGLDDRGVGMALSKDWKTPFTRLNNGAAVLGPSSPARTRVDEDMHLWHNHRGIQMLLHEEGAGAVGGHGYSVDDGLSWTVAGDAYDFDVTNADGTTTQYERRERPQLLKNTAGEPLYLFSGVEDADGFTHTIAVPLDLT
eukprot:m.101619 g.101619  ORF g.101619 m.101619 type:complete len:358 (+) comp27338_c0_seq1:145-1218(+)